MREVRCPILVGRASQLDILTGALEQAASGAGGVVFLLGEAGMGKTRLAAEVEALAHSFAMAVLPGRATPAATPDPYRPLTEAFLSAWRSREPPEGPALEGLRPAVENPGADMGPTRGQRRASPSVVTVGEAALTLLDGLGGAGALLVIDDLQWCDPESLEVLGYLADKVAQQPVLIVATARSGEGPAAERLARTLASRHCARLVPLGPLDDTGIRAAIAAALGMSDPPPELVTAIGDRAGGSPFLIEELLASLIAAGALARVGTGWQVQHALPAVVPESFARAVADRLTTLSTPARRAVELAAVLGERFDWRLVAATTTRRRRRRHA